MNLNFFNIVIFNSNALEHNKLQDHMKNTNEDTLLYQYESRIRKTESDKHKISNDIQPEYDNEGEEEEDYELEDPLHEDQRHQPECSQEDYEYLNYHKIPYNIAPDKYQETNSDQYVTADYENVINTTYAKAKKYKRKAKKLYSNLQKLKAHYTKAKQKVSYLEAENEDLSNKMMMLTDRINEIEYAFVLLIYKVMIHIYSGVYSLFFI